MADNDIKKALECCANWESDKSCEDCPANTYGFGCAQKMAKHSLDLINRLEAQIDELQHKITSCNSEAIKAFAEKLETALDERVSEKIRERNPHWYLAKRIVRETAIEMTEQSTGYGSSKTDKE